VGSGGTGGGDVDDVGVSAYAELDVARRQDVATVERIAGGDDESFRQLFRRYAPHANALALRLLRQPFLAEEAVQDAFVGVWTRAAAYDPRRGSVRSWVMSMVHNRAVDLVRREESQRRRAAASEDVAVIEDHADDVVRRVGSSEERERVRSALAALPEDQRRVIELMYFGGMSQSAIAERLAIPLGTVKSRTLLGMRRLRERLVGMER
jgi:RNA polymerase sigma-70 factor (ECF subfamily)